MEKRNVHFRSPIIARGRQLWATRVAYYRSGKITAGTIEHEALHFYLGMFDDQLQTQLGLRREADATNITDALKEHHCTK